MTYEEAVKKLGITLHEASFNVAVTIFDKTYGECAKEKGVYEDALSLFLLHKDVLGDGATSGGSQSVEYVSVTDGDSTGTSNYLKDMMDLLVAVGCAKRRSNIAVFAYKVKGTC